MDEIFNHRIGVFKTKAVQRYSLGFRELTRMAALWEFDFSGLLEPFGRKGAYGACDAALVAPALRDLHFLVNGLEIGREAVEVYALMRELTLGIGGAGDPAAEVVAVAAILAKELRADRIGAVARAAASDVACEACAERLKELCDDYAAKRALQDESARAQELEARKRALFGDRELEGVLGYTDELSALFRENSLPGLAFAAPLAVIKTFTKAFYLTFIRGAISALLVDADFSDEDFHRALVAAFDDCSLVASELQALEDDLISPGSSRLMPVADALAKGRLDPAARRAAEDGITKTERRCDGIMRAAFSSFAALRTALDKLLIDLRAKQPEFIANAHYINRNMAKALSGLEESSRLLTLCLKNLRPFSADLGDLGRAIEKSSPESSRQ